jgi:YhcH/YjgK/YiaL family protein
VILDCIEHWKQYIWPNPRFAAGLEFIQTLQATAPEGRYDLDGENLYAMVQTYETRPREGHKFEAHRVYADIQCLLAGEEAILWAPTRGLTVVQPYEPDIEFYALDPGATELVLIPGRFCVLFPQDAHAPCTTHRAPSAVRKAVVKVRLS